MTPAKEAGAIAQVQAAGWEVPSVGIVSDEFVASIEFPEWADPLS